MAKEKNYNHIEKLDVNQKIELLDRNIWKKSEACAYLGFQRPAMEKLFKELKRKTYFPCTIYRDEFLELLGTSADKEYRLLKEFQDGKSKPKKK